MDNLTIAIVGCGRMGKVRAQAAVAFGANVIAVCDDEAARSHELAAQFSGCEAITSVEKIDLGLLDALFICTPPSARGTLELRCIEHGVPFLVEKPLGLSATSIESVGRALRDKPVVNAAGYMNRYRPSIQAVRRWAAGKQILGMSRRLARRHVWRSLVAAEVWFRRPDQ